MLIPGVTRWKPNVLRALDAWLAIDPVNVDRAIAEAGLSRDLFSEVILGVIQRESSGNPNANGDSGCSFGLMQFNWCIRQSPAGRGELQYPDETGVLRIVTSSTQLLDPDINIRVSMKFLLNKLAEFRDVNLAIEAYNNPSRSWFNQDYLDAVLRAIGVSPEFYADLKKKSKRTDPDSSWQRLLDLLRTKFSKMESGSMKRFPHPFLSDGLPPGDVCVCGMGKRSKYHNNISVEHG